MSLVCNTAGRRNRPRGLHKPELTVQTPPEARNSNARYNMSFLKAHYRLGFALAVSLGVWAHCCCTGLAQRHEYITVSVPLAEGAAAPAAAAAAAVASPTVTENYDGGSQAAGAKAAGAAGGATVSTA